LAETISIEVVGDFAGEAGPRDGEADAEVPVFDGLEALQNNGKVIGR
jgi:hypothetical protein